MKTRFNFLVMLVFGFSINAQNDAMDAPNSVYETEYTYVNQLSIKLGVGLFIPQGELQNYFGNAPLFELSANFPFKRRKSIDAVFQFIVPNQQDEFLFLRTIDTIEAKSTFMFNAFLRFKTHIYQNNTSKINLGLGLGVSTIITNARNPYYSGEQGERKYEYISALLLMPGIEWCYRFSGETELTVGIDFQYAPYKMEGALREDIGAMALIPKIMYRF